MNTTKLGIIAALIVIIIVIIIILISNTRKEKRKDEIEKINIRFNEVKSFPIAYKLSKAQSIAKRNEESAEEVKGFFEKYEEVQKHLDACEKLIEDLEDNIALNSKSDIDSQMKEINECINKIEKEIRDVDSYLDRFEEEESHQRNYSLKLKEEFRELKLYIHENRQQFIYADEGVEERIANCEELFTQSEDLMFAADYAGAGKILLSIEKEIREMKDSFMDLPELIQMIKSNIPALLEEVKKEYALSRQRGINLESYKIDEKISFIENQSAVDLKQLQACKAENVREHCENATATLKTILENLEKENGAFEDTKTVAKDTENNLEEAKKLIEYVLQGYKEQKERFVGEDIEPQLKDIEKQVKEYDRRYNECMTDIRESKDASSILLQKINNLYNETEITRKSLLTYKMKIDKTTSDEQRASSQLQKLQVVVNEVELKVKEYRLPTIADSYYDDLDKSRVYISEIRELLDGVPIDQDKLNSKVEEAIDFIYRFYNNVNNIVGMAMMVENAIVFGNKYRSSYHEVDQELSKAEFYYMNGEYTKALTTAITCLEKLFPNIPDSKMLENA